VREDPQVHLGTLDGFNFTLDDLLCSRELFSNEADTLTFDTKAPVSIPKHRSFGGSASGIGMIPVSNVNFRGAS